MSEHIVFLGAGPAGYSGAVHAADLGFNVTVVDKDVQPGGTCLNRGCIPAKTLLTGANLINKIKKASEFGITAENIKMDISRLMHKKMQVVSLLGKGIESLFRDKKINYIKGNGKFFPDKRIEVNTKDGRLIIKADHIILANGSVPFIPNGFPYDRKTVMTSDDILEIDHIPATLVIIGGGVIGLEMAYLFSSLGSKVTVIEMLDRIGFNLDEDVSKLLTREFKKRNITVLTSSKVNSSEIKEGNVFIKTDDKEIISEKALVSIGRRANLEGIDPAESGLIMDKGWLKVDEYLATNLEGVYAAGDLIGSPWLAHAASYQAITAVNNIAGRLLKYDSQNIPACVFTYPEISCVGMTQEKANELNLDYKIGKFDFRAFGKAHAQGEIEGFVKILLDNKNQKLIGVHIIGPEASSLIAESVLALKTGMNIKEFSELIRVHPTLPEAVMEAALTCMNISTG